MALFAAGAGAAGLGAGLQGLFGWLSSREQADANEAAMRLAGQQYRTQLQRNDTAAENIEAAGGALANSIGNAYGTALQTLGQNYGTINNSYDAAQGRYNQALGYWQPAQQSGNQALQRLTQAILGGGADAYQLSPQAQFQQQQGELAIQRAASAGGTLGSGTNLKDFARFNQDLASNDYQNYLNNLTGLYGIGERASMQSQAALGNLAQTDLGRGAALTGLTADVANLQLGGGRESANALYNAAQNANQIYANAPVQNNLPSYLQNQGQIQGNYYQNIGNSFANVGNQALQFYALNQLYGKGGT